MKILPVRAELFHADRRTDGRTDRKTDRYDEAGSRYSQLAKTHKVADYLHTK
jgi:hypothetical protein